MGFKDDANSMTSDLVTTVFAQYHINKGIKKFGQPGVDVITAELKQLHDKIVLNPKKLADMYVYENDTALQHLMCLKNVLRKDKKATDV